MKPIKLGACEFSLRLRESQRTRLREILSPLEFEVFEQISAGHTAKQTSDKLSRRRTKK
jgi:DNA-binding CsgD family transcriptional regulator